MAKRLDRVLVIDVESTCWPGAPPRGQISEIIEIGLCLVDIQRRERVEKRSIFVRPQVSEVSEFCTRLTSITPEMAASGISLEQALDILRNDYDAYDRLFASWGDYDRNQFQRNCDYFRLKYPFGPTHLNVKTLFAIAHALPRETGIDAAFEILNQEMEGTHHRGVDDAWNIAGIFCQLLGRLRVF